MTRINRLAAIALATGATFALPSVASAQKIIVNEINRTAGSISSSGTRDEWVEYLIVEDVTAAELNGYYVGDSQAARNSKLSSEQFTNMQDIAPVLLAGTLILVTGDQGLAEDLNYDPLNGDWNITLVSSAVAPSPNLTRIRATWDFAANDVAWIDTNDEVLAGPASAISSDGFGVAYTALSGALGATCNVAIGAPANTGSGTPPIAYTTAALESNLAGATDAANWNIAATPTPGQPNGGENTDYIMTLRREAVLLIELESFTATAAHAGAPVVLNWVTASEIDTVGFNVRRARFEDGRLVPGALVNTALIPAEGTAGSGASYSLTDPVAVGDAPRAYFLMELDANGTRTPYGPFRAAVGGSPSNVSEWPQY